MEILDCDMQMVRDFLDEKEAPYYIEGHFENLLSEYEKAVDDVDDLENRVEELECEESKSLAKARDELVDLQDRFDDLVNEGMRGALESVRYWLLDSLVHHKPVKDPRKMLRIVEDGLSS